MARVVPQGWQALRNSKPSAQLARELDTLELLASRLPDQVTIYHGVHWNRVEGAQSLFGEIDFALVGAGGRVLLVEQQTGFLNEMPGASGPRAAQAIRHRLGQAAASVRTGLAALTQGVAVEVLLFLPDYTVRDAGSVGLDPARIVDARSRDALVERVESLLAGQVPVDAPAVHRYFADALMLEPDVGSTAQQASDLYVRLSGGLTEWARRIEMSPHRLRVIGTAGSGKTQLALAIYREALAAGRKPLYLCFNRPLADHFATLVPPGGEVATYRQYCNRAIRSHGINVDFSAPDAFDRVEAAFAAMAVDSEWRCDELIIDEGQDFSAAWRDAALRLLKPEGRGWWLEDPSQNLYDREPVALPGWVTLRSTTNYRSPQGIVDFLNTLRPDAAIDAGSPVAGTAVDVQRYTDREDLLERTRRAVTAAIGQGFSRDQIVVLSFHGRERSAFNGVQQLGPIPLRRFTGYDALGIPLFSQGDVLFETVYRFKGQSAPCVIFTEVDFEAFDEVAWRKLFVGATRASLRLSVLLSATAAQACGLETETAARPGAAH